MNIAFDIDGVLYPWHTAVYNYLLNTKPGFNLSYEELWDPPFTYFNSNGAEYIASLPLLYLNIVPKRAILSMLNTLSDSGHTLYYITYRPDNVHRVTRKYLEDYKFPQYSNLTFDKDKGKMARILEIDVFIEDRPENLEQLSVLCRTIGISHPWNEGKREYLESLGVLFIPSVECLVDIL